MVKFSLAGYLVFAVIMLGVAIAAFILNLQGIGSGLFFGAVIVFFLVKVALAWLVRKHAIQAGESALLARDWRLLSVGSFVSASLFVLAGAAGDHRPWSWFCALGSGSLAWAYLAVSQKAGGQDAAA